MDHKVDSDIRSDRNSAGAAEDKCDKRPLRGARSTGEPAPPGVETLLDALPCPVYYKDANGVFLGYNKSYSEQILGDSAPSLIGKSIADLRGRIPEDLAAFYMNNDAAIINQTGFSKSDQSSSFSLFSAS